MTEWILIAFLYIGYKGGPMDIRFADKPSCEQALAQIKVSLDQSFNQGVCVPASSEKVTLK